MNCLTKNLLFLASGRGSNFQSFLDHVRLGVLTGVTISALICNQRRALVLERANSAGIETLEIDGVAGKKFGSQSERNEARSRFDEKVGETMESKSIDYTVLAGFDQILGKDLVEGHPYKFVNIHPAYNLQRFGGKNMVGIRVHELSLSSGAEYSGCTVHFVVPEVDQGPAILRQRVPILPNDTPKTLEERILIQEHLVYPKAIQLLVDGRVRVQGSADCVVDIDDAWLSSWTKRQSVYQATQGEIVSGELIYD